MTPAEGTRFTEFWRILSSNRVVARAARRESNEKELDKKEIVKKSNGIELSTFACFLHFTLFQNRLIFIKEFWIIQDRIKKICRKTK
jgi:hypothetical protein